MVTRHAVAAHVVEQLVVHMGLVDIVLQLVGVGLPSVVTHQAVLHALLNGIAHDDEAMVGGLVHLGVFQRFVARQAAALFAVEPGHVVAFGVGRHRLNLEAVAVGVGGRLVQFGVALLFLGMGVNLRKLIDVIDKTAVALITNFAANFAVNVHLAVVGVPLFLGSGRCQLRRAGGQQHYGTCGAGAGGQSDPSLPSHSIPFFKIPLTGREGGRCAWPARWFSSPVSDSRRRKKGAPSS